MADAYCHQLLKIAIAQICQGLGWHAIQSTPCDLLNDILQRYIEHIARYTHRYAEQYGRTEPNLDDTALAFSDMQVRLGEFEVYLRDVDPVPFVHSLPQFPVAKATNLQHPRPGSRDCRERLWYIPAHMPPLVGVSRDLAEVVDPIEPGTTGYPYSSEADGSSMDMASEYTPGHATPRGDKRDLANPYTDQAMKRLRLADDGTPQELTTIFMGVNGELTPKREGKLPEATTPPQRDWHRPSLPQSPLARKGSEGQPGDMPHRRTPDMATPPLIKPPKSPKAAMKSPVSPIKAPPPKPLFKPQPKSPKHLMFSPHAPSKFQVKPKTPVSTSAPVVDLTTRPEQASSPAPKSPKAGYLSMLTQSKKRPESPKVAPQEPPKAPILKALMKKKETAKDTALKVFDFEDDFDFGSAPSVTDRPHAAMDSFASSKVPSSKPITEPKEETSQYSTSESIDASIEAVIAGISSRSLPSTVQDTGKSKKHKESKEHKESKDKSDRKDKGKDKKDKHKDKEKSSKEGKEKNREEKKEATVLFGPSSPYSFDDSVSAAMKKRDDAQKSSSKGHSLPPKLFLKKAWRDNEGAVTSSIRIRTEPGQAPKLVIKTENPASEKQSESESKKAGLTGKEKAKLKMKKKEKLKIKKKKEKLMMKKLEKKKMLQSSTVKDGESSKPKEEEAIPKINIISKGVGLKIKLSSSPQVTPEHKASMKEDKGEKSSKDKNKKKKKDKDKDRDKDKDKEKDKKQKKKEGKKGEGKKEDKDKKEKKDKKDKKTKSDSAASSPAPSQPIVPKIIFKMGGKSFGGGEKRSIVIKPSPDESPPDSPPSFSSSPSPSPSPPPPMSPVRKPKASPKPPKSPATPRSPKSPTPVLPISVPPVRKASLAASKAVSLMSSSRSTKGVSPPSAAKAEPEKRKAGSKSPGSAAPASSKAGPSKVASPKTSPKATPVPTKAALAVGKGPPAGKAAAAGKATDTDDNVQRSVITETIGTFFNDKGEKVWICPTCKQEDDGSPMVGCDDCDDWYHWPCVGIDEEPDEEDWFCTKCAKLRKQQAKGISKGKKKKKKHKD